MTDTARDLVIVGAGGHGRELASVVASNNQVEPHWNLLGFVDDGSPDLERLARIDVTFLGTLSWLIEHPGAYAVGIGSPPTRRSLSQQLGAAGCTAATIVSPYVRLGLDVRLGDGVVIYDNSVLTTNVTIGRHTHINVGCSVQHDSTIGEFVQMSPGVFVNGDVTISNDVFLGTGAIVTRGVTIGDSARIGAGAVVLDDVAPDTLVVGAPARPVHG